MNHSVKQWWHQRITAIFLLPCTIWLIIFMLELIKNEVILSSALSSPFNVSMLSISLGIAMYHAFLGVKVIIEDYISHLFIRKMFIVLLQGFVAVTMVFLYTSLVYMLI